MSETPSNGAPSDAAAPELLRVENLRKYFETQGSRLRRRPGNVVRAVDDVSFTVGRGETFGLVGESGCGKSTVARCILRLLEPTSGRIVFDGVDVANLPRDEMRQLRRRMQIVFQDPYGSLNPRMNIDAIVGEPLAIHSIGEASERRQKVIDTLELVGVTEQQSHRKPHEFSGGQRQRIALARALILEPDLIILDEPVSALDVSIQAQVLNLLRELQERLNLTYVFIVHDLAVAEYFCDRLAVLYLGAVMELADRDRLFREPLHPYTDALLSAVPVPDPAIEREREHVVLAGEVTDEPLVSGCRFRPRCPIGGERERCGSEEPQLVANDPGHEAACHFPGEMHELVEAGAIED